MPLERWLESVAVCAVLLAPAQPAAAQNTLRDAASDAGAGSLDAVPEALKSGITMSRDKYLRRQMLHFRYLSRNERLDGPGIDEAAAIERAEARSKLITQYLLFDLDGDLQVTSEEVRRRLTVLIHRRGGPHSTASVAAQVDRMLPHSMPADRDHDGVMTREEIVAFADAQAARHIEAEIANMRALLALDPNGDGVLTANEFETLAKAAHERAAQMRGQAPARAARRAATRTVEPCPLPKPAAGDRVVMLGGYEGDRLSSVTVAGPDKVTTSALLDIEPGEAPLYLILSSFKPMVWQVGGETGRLSRLVVLPSRYAERPGAGVIGVPRDKIDFLPQGVCFKYFSGAASGAGRQARAIVEGALRRGVDDLIGAYTLRPMRVPSGSTAPPAAGTVVGRVIASPHSAPLLQTENGFRRIDRSSRLPGGMRASDDARAWMELQRYNPGGLARLSAADVVAPGPVEAYDVLPEQAGISQLIGEGAIERLSDGMLLIRKPIPRYPAGLAGAHSVRFMLGKGVPVPGGSPGHSCVISEETGQPLTRTPSCGQR